MSKFDLEDFFMQNKEGRKKVELFNYFVGKYSGNRGVDDTFYVEGKNFYTKEAGVDRETILYFADTGANKKRANWKLWYNAKHERETKDVVREANRVVFLNLSNNEEFGNPYPNKDKDLNIKYHKYQVLMEQIKADMYANALMNTEDLLYDENNYYAILKVLLNKPEYQYAKNFKELATLIFENQKETRGLSNPEEVYNFIFYRNKYADKNKKYNIFGKDFKKFKNNETVKKLKKEKN